MNINCERKICKDSKLKVVRVIEYARPTDGHLGTKCLAGLI